MSKSVDKALQTMIDNMPAKTGKSLEEWKQVLSEHSFDKHMQAVNYLKKEHGVTHGFANTIVSLAKSESEPEVDLVAQQYSGKEALLPIYQSLRQFVNSLGSDVTVTPKKSSVSVIRKRQFVLIKPATKTRIDLGLKLPGRGITDRLETSGPFGTMCTHRVRIAEIEQVDEELKSWIQDAYDQAG